ncbi:MAG: hypothetical protein WAO21_00835 [Verrucomicrobiia bacterium]
MPTVVLLWVWFCAYLNCAGWALSAVHELNPGGYVVALLIGFSVLCVWRKRTSAQMLPRARLKKFRRRFRRPFPLVFLILAALAFLGGALYPPTNYDALAYRIPRVLHWLAAGQWHWIHTIFDRLNDRSCGIEWVSAPFVALLGTDRELFLINVVSFLLLPGLVFSVFTRLGVRRRTAWHWMWIVPTGYCFLLQAGSIGSDLFGAPFALAAIDFALRAKKSRSARNIFVSILAAAMMTSAKTSNLPLLLPWAIAILPSPGLMLRRPLKTAAVCAIAAFASFLPNAVLNAHFCGDWTGWKIEGTPQRNAPFLRVPANAALITVQNLAPPVFPPVNAWDRLVQKIVPSGLSRRMREAVVEPQAAGFHIEEMQVEETAGLGFGVTIFFLVSVVAAAARRSGPPCHWPSGFTEALWLAGLRLAPWISLLVLLSQSEVYPIDRILAPYYALLAPFFLAFPGHEQLVKKNWWRAMALPVFLIAAGLLVVSPARPLFPVGVFLEKIHAAAEQHPSLARVEAVYSVYHERNDAFAPARAALPPDLKILGLIAFDTPETSLWRPFGSRRIEHVRPGDQPADLKQRGIEYVLVKTDSFEFWFGCSPDDWVRRMNAQVIQKIPLRLNATGPGTGWYLVKLP